MTSGNGSQQHYAISMSQIQRMLLLHLHLEQEALGRAQGFVVAYREILRRLRRDPRIFGEQLYTLPILK